MDSFIRHQHTMLPKKENVSYFSLEMAQDPFFKNPKPSVSDLILGFEIRESLPLKDLFK